MEANVVIVLITLAFLSLMGTLFYSFYLLRQSQKDIKDIATEAILSSKAVSGQDLAIAQMQVHQAKVEREQMPSSQAPFVPEPYVPHITGPNGEPLEVLRPFGGLR